MQKEPYFDDQLVSTQIRNLMEKNGITKRHQVNQLSQILKLSFSHAHRKMKGESPWTLFQINEVARHFGESANTLVDISVSSDVEQRPLQEALLVLDSPKELKCLMRLGEKITDRNQSEYVASYVNGEWRLFLIESAPKLADLFTVDLIKILPKTSSNEAQIAVVDDALDSANNLSDYLSANGFKAQAFYATASFKEAYKQNINAIDALVIDWWLGSETAEQAIREIRELSTKQIPIFLLTGELKTGRANEGDINRVMRTYNVTCVEKPVRMSLLAGNLEKELRLLETMK